MLRTMPCSPSGVRRHAQIFFMKPADGPQTRQTVVAQITVPTGKPWKAQALFQGQTRAREGVWDDFLT